MGAAAAEDTYPGIASSEPCGLHGPAGDGASGHHLRQDGPIAAFLIVMWVPGERGRTRASALGPTPLRSSVPTTTWQVIPGHSTGQSRPGQPHHHLGAVGTD